MASVAVEQNAEELQRLIDAAIRRLDADSARVGRALRAIPVSDPDGVSRDLFRALAAARRNALGIFANVLALETPHPAKGRALTWLALGAAGLGAFYRSLRAGDTPSGRRQDRLAQAYFTRATAAFGEMDRALGCPYGCKVGG